MFNFNKLTFPDTGISIVISYRDRYGRKRIEKEYISPNKFPNGSKVDIEVPRHEFRYAMSIKNLQEK